MTDIVDQLDQHANMGAYQSYAIDPRVLFRAAKAEIERLKAERKNCPPVSESEYVRRLEDDLERLKIENWQLKGALGYPVPGDIPEGTFKCGLCEARRLAPNP